MVRRISDYDELEPVEEEVVGKEEKREESGEGVKEAKEEKEEEEKPAAASKIPDFAEVVATPPLEGERRRIEEILGKPIVVEDYIQLQSKFRDGTYVVMKVRVEGENEPVTVATGSEVLQEQLEMMRDAGSIPFKAKIVRKSGKRGKYLTFTSSKE